LFYFVNVTVHELNNRTEKSGINRTKRTDETGPVPVADVKHCNTLFLLRYGTF
jgi:hypothetical protein